MADIDLKAATPDTSLPSTGFLFGADSQSAVSPSVYSVQAVATALLGSTSLTGATETTSKPMLDLAQTWNAGAVTFTGLKANITDTASASGSLLMDLQVGGSSRFNVSKAGIVNAVRFTGTAYSSIAEVSISNSSGVRQAGMFLGFGGVPVGLTLNNAGVISWDSSSSAVNGTPDLFLTRRAAASLRLGAADAAAPVAQTLGVQSVVAGTTNTAGVNLTITGSQGTGTGAGGSIIFQTAPAGASGTSQNALATALTITSAQEIKCAGPLWVSNAYAAGAPTATGYIVLYDSTGTAYKIPAVAV